AAREKPRHDRRQRCLRRRQRIRGRYQHRDDPRPQRQRGDAPADDQGRARRPHLRSPVRAENRPALDFTSFMGMPGNPKPVKLFAALLSSKSDLLVDAETELSALFGPVDARSEVLPWAVSDYYAPEMGSDLYRQFVAFSRPLSPEALPEIKLQTQEIERRHRAGGGRRINIDPGYIDAGKVVLAS